jgi:choline dehydrogenase-like flavoprotein
MCADKCSSFDVVIVGSGVAGALIAKQLGLAGKSVLMLEAGPGIPSDINGYMKRFFLATAKVPESPYPPDLLADPGKVNAGRAASVMLGPTNWKDPRKSYLIQNGPLAFGSTYERVGGGTSLHWLGTSLRFLPSDFKMQTLYKRFVDWPISYEDLDKDLDNSWYGKAEAELGVSADADEQAYLGVKFPAGYSYPMPKIPLSKVDKTIASKIAGLTIDGTALNVKSTPAARNSRPYRQRRVCAGNTNCIPICPIQAKYDPTVTVNEALRTGNVKIMYKTVASEVVIGENGRVSQINYIQYDDEIGPRSGTGCVTAKVFIIAANAMETPRLLLMSKNGGRTPNGVANSSGLVGRNLMDHPYLVTWGLMPESDRVFPYRGPLSTGGIEELRDGEFRRERGAYRIEIGNEGWNFVVGGVGDDPGVTTLDFVNGLNVSGLNKDKESLFGSTLVKRLNNRLSRQFRLGFLIEQSPDSSNRVTLSERHRDGLGLPRPQITYNLSDYTKKGLAAAKQASDAIFRKLNAESFTVTNPNDPSSFEWVIDGKRTRLSFFGAGHIVGTHRMGTSRNNSVVDRDQRCWSHQNLYLVGSGTFPTVATANPTLTIAALSLRTADNILRTDLR